MANRWCDHGAYDAYAATPTWGVPQDGNGKAKAPSTAAATASIVFTGTPAGTISVCGVTVTPTWGSGADAAANGLATAINAATGNVTTAGFRSAAVPLRNAVFARGPAGGAPAGTCQIMSRHGSADLNGLVAIAHTLTNVNAGASSLSFSGGADGCWGYLVTGLTPTIWPQALTAYGILSTNPPLMYAVAAGDVIKVRSNKTINLGSITGGDLAFGATSFVAGTQAAPITVLIDDGTEWTEGDAEPVLNVNCTFNANRNFGIQFAGNEVQILARKYSDTKYGLQYTIDGAGICSWGIGNGNNIWRGVSVRNPTGSVTLRSTQSAAVTSRQRVQSCRIAHPSNAVFFGAHSNSHDFNVDYVDFVVDATGATVPNTAGIVAYLSSFSAAYSRTFLGVKFVGFVPGSNLFAPASYNTSVTHDDFQDCDWGGVSVFGPIYSGRPETSFQSSLITASSSLGNQDFFADSRRGYIDWNSALGFPTLGAQLLNGTPYSVRMIPSFSATYTTETFGLYSPKFSKVNTLGESVLDVEVNIAVHEDLTADRESLVLEVSYEKPDGTREFVSSKSAGALDASTETWSSESGGQVTFVSGTTQSHDKKKLSLTTPTAVKAGSVVTAVVVCRVVAANSSQAIFVDPDPRLSV